MLDILELKLKIVVSCHICAGNEPRSTSSSQDCFTQFLNNVYKHNLQNINAMNKIIVFILFCIYETLILYNINVNIL